MARRIARFGWVPQQPDHRDRIYNLEEHVLQDQDPALPAKYDLWPNVPPIWDQGQEGSCTAHGSLRALITEMMRQGLEVPQAAPDGAPFSRQAQYYWTRSLEGTTATDSGAQVRDAVKVLASTGAAPETDWPYTEPLTTEPPASVQQAAGSTLALKYQSILTNGPGAPMRTAVSSGLAIVFGFTVPSTFEDGSWNPATEVFQLPAAGVGTIGGHCVAVTGYDFSCTQFPQPYFICDNSWASTWGGAWGGTGCTGGRFAMAYDWFDVNRGLATDLWVLQSAN